MSAPLKFRRGDVRCSILYVILEGDQNEKNIPAKEETETQRARLQKENGKRRRQKSSQEKKSKRQKETHCISYHKGSIEVMSDDAKR